MAAARLGFEPRYQDSESWVLPLDDLAMCIKTINQQQTTYNEKNNTKMTSFQRRDYFLLIAALMNAVNSGCG